MMWMSRLCMGLGAVCLVGAVGAMAVDYLEPKPGEGVVIADMERDIGELAPGEQRVVEFQVKNVTRSPRQIINLRRL